MSKLMTTGRNQCTNCRESINISDKTKIKFKCSSKKIRRLKSDHELSTVLKFIAGLPEKKLKKEQREKVRFENHVLIDCPFHKGI